MTQWQDHLKQSEENKVKDVEMKESGWRR